MSEATNDLDVKGSKVTPKIILPIKEESTDSIMATDSEVDSNLPLTPLRPIISRRFRQPSTSLVASNVASTSSLLNNSNSQPTTSNSFVGNSFTSTTSTSTGTDNVSPIPTPLINPFNAQPTPPSLVANNIPSHPTFIRRISRVIAPNHYLPPHQILSVYHPLSRPYFLRPTPSISSSNLNSSITSLSLELLQLVLSFIPVTSYRARQIQNIQLATVNKSFFSLVYLQLQHEIHITSAEQIPALDLLFKRNPARLSQISFVTIDLDIDDLRWNQFRPQWSGSSFQSLIRQLSSVNNVSITLRRKESIKNKLSITSDLCEITGGLEPIFEQFRNVVEMRLSFDLSPMEKVQLLNCHGIQLQRLFISSSKQEGGKVVGRENSGNMIKSSNMVLSSIRNPIQSANRIAFTKEQLDELLS